VESLKIVVRNSIVLAAAKTITVPVRSQFVHAEFRISPRASPLPFRASDSQIIVTTTFDYNNGFMVRFKSVFRIAGKFPYLELQRVQRWQRKQ